jgi:hypothetical protein
VRRESRRAGKGQTFLGPVGFLAAFLRLPYIELISLAVLRRGAGGAVPLLYLCVVMCLDAVVEKLKSSLRRLPKSLKVGLTGVQKETLFLGLLGAGR